MKSRVHTVLLLVCLATVHSLHAQSTQESTLSLQGFSGILNTPNARVQQEGTFAALYSNQNDHLLPGTGIPYKEDSYLFSVGLFSFAEVGGRLTSAPVPDGGDGVRHLSTTLKVSSDQWTSRLRFSPAIAVGLQDVGGQTHFLETKYVAGSVNPVGWLQLSGGYGAGPDRMKGLFGGVELRAQDWVSLLADYDTRNANVGVRLTAPALPHFPARFTATFATPVEDAHNVVASGGFIIPLDFKRASRRDAALNTTSEKPAAQKTLWGALTARKAQPSAAKPSSESNGLASVPPYNPMQSSAVMPSVEPSSQNSTVKPQWPSEPPYNPAQVSAVTPVVTPSSQNNNAEWPVVLRDRLIKDGFVNVRVGLQGKTLVLVYENIRYNHNELDAIGVVFGIVSQTAGDGADQLRVVVKRKGLALLQIETPIVPLRNWLEGSAPAAAPELIVSQKLTSEDGVSFVAGPGNPGRLKPSVMVYPSITTLVGTEYGVFDYELTIRPELQLPLWRGATAVARWDIPVSWSGNLDNGRIYAGDRTPAELDRAMFFQALPLAPGLVANVGAGRILTTDNGVLNELSWIPGGGMNRFKVIQSWGRDTGTTRDVLLGSYRLFLARRNLAFEGIAGRFYAQDTGLSLSMQRFFGDASVSVYFKDTVTPTDSKRWLQGGIQFEFPLTPRRDMKARPIQIRGNEDWLYAQETGIASSAGQTANYVEPDLAIVPAPTQDLALYFYDRERLNAAYILSHTERIKEAWQTFRDHL